MTTNAMASPAVPIQLAAKDKRAILENVLAALRKRFYSPEKLNGDWQAAVERHKAADRSCSDGGRIRASNERSARGIADVSHRVLS